MKQGGIVTDLMIHWAMNTMNLLVARSITKEERRAIVEEWVSILKKSGFDDQSLGYLVLGVHLFFGSVLGFALVFSALDVYYLWFVLMMLLVILLTVYFNGCILVKIEQEFLGKAWKGDVHHFFSLFGFDLSSKQILSFFTTRMYMLVAWIAIRAWYGF